MVSGYLVEVRPTDSSTYAIAGKVTSPCFRAHNLSPKKSYIFRVKSINSMGPSEEAAVLKEPACIRPLVGKYLGGVGGRNGAGVNVDKYKRYNMKVVSWSRGRVGCTNL